MKWRMIACAALLIALTIGVRRLQDAETAKSAEMIATVIDSSADLIPNNRSSKTQKISLDERGNSIAAARPAEQGMLVPNAPSATTNAQTRTPCVPASVDHVATPAESSAEVPSIESTEGVTSKLDKEACFAAVRELRRARWMFDATATKVVMYSAGRPWHGAPVQEILIGQLCAGEQPFDAAVAPTIEMFFVTAEKSTRVVIGPNWASEGTIQAPLTEGQYSQIAKTLADRRTQEVGSGGNAARTAFDKRMEGKYYNRITAEEEAQKRSDNERRRAQQGLPLYCKE